MSFGLSAPFAKPARRPVRVRMTGRTDRETHEEQRLVPQLEFHKYEEVNYLFINLFSL